MVARDMLSDNSPFASVGLKGSGKSSEELKVGSNEGQTDQCVRLLEALQPAAGFY
jgi:hypothetical protein